MKRQLIIVAGGSGKRMGLEIPKQFVNIKGKPLLMWTAELFMKCRIAAPFILVLPQCYFELWSELCQKHNFLLSYKLVEGGNTRFQSVFNGLNEIEDNSVVAIHDGVRPFVSASVVENAFIVAQHKGNAVPAIEIKESVRKIENGENTVYHRNLLRIVQTPQVFNSAIIKKAYHQKFTDEFTDDASVVEHLGYKINLIEGNFENIKITTPSDLDIASAMMKNFPY